MKRNALILALIASPLLQAHEFKAPAPTARDLEKDLLQYPSPQAGPITEARKAKIVFTPSPISHARGRMRIIRPKKNVDREALREAPAGVDSKMIRKPST